MVDYQALASDAAKTALAAQRDHFAEYENLAQMIGVAAIMRVINSAGITANTVRDAFDKDRHLSAISLPRWDRMHTAICQLHAAKYPRGSWSLSRSVCVAKHVARHHLAGIPRP